MPKLRYTNNQLLIVMGLLAASCGLLVTASEWSASFVFSVTIATLTVAVLGAICRRGRARAFWLGFAVVGWGYLVLVHTPITSGTAISSADRTWRLQEDGPIITTRILVWGYQHWLRPPQQPMSGSGMFGALPFELTRVQFGGLGGGSGAQRIRVTPSPPRGPELADYLCIGQSLFTLFFAFLGGVVARCFYEREEKSAAATGKS